MLTKYLAAMMRHAEYKDLGAEGWFAHVTGVQGPWANAATREETERELRSVLEDWLLLGLRFGDPLPVVDGIDLNVKLEPADVA